MLRLSCVVWLYLILISEKKKDKKKADDGPEEKLKGVHMFANGDKYGKYYIYL